MIKRVFKWTGLVLAALLLAALIVPLIIPIPALQTDASVEDLKDADSRFVTIDGIDVHYKRFGQGQPVMILLHGFGASTFSWREVNAPLAASGSVIAYDRPAFGLTERPMPGDWQGQSPYSVPWQAKMLIGLMDALGVEKAVLVGNSAGGTVATLTALEYPERVQALVLVDAAIYSGPPASALMRLLYQTPQVNRLAPLLVRSIARTGDDTIRLAWHDPSRVTADIIAGYRKPLQLPNWDRALWELTKASQPLGLAERLGELDLPVLVLTGDDDRIVPTASSLRLAREIPFAQLQVFATCGHVPQEECPVPFVQAVESFLRGLE